MLALYNLEYWIMLHTRLHHSDSYYTSLFFCLTQSHGGAVEKMLCAYHAHVQGLRKDHVPSQTDAGRNSVEHTVDAPCTKTAETQSISISEK